MDTKYLRTSGHKHWYWTPFTYGFGAGGWFYFNWRKPLATLRWLARYRHSRYRERYA